MINVKHTKVDVVILHKAVIKRRGPGISPSYYERGPRLRSKEKKRKIEPKEIPSCLIPRLLVVFTRHLESLVTTLTTVNMHTYWDTIGLFNVEHKILNKGYFIQGKNNLYPWKRMKDKKKTIFIFKNNQPLKLTVDSR